MRLSIASAQALVFLDVSRMEAVSGRNHGALTSDRGRFVKEALAARDAFDGEVASSMRAAHSLRGNRNDAPARRIWPWAHSSSVVVQKT